MTTDARDDLVVARIRQAIADAVARLVGEAVPDEALAAFVPPRRVFLLPRKAVMVPLGRVWRLGVFLLDRQGVLYQAGTTTRAVPPGHPGHTAASTEKRRVYRAAAQRGPFAAGETVNFHARVIDLDPGSLRIADGPLFLSEGGALVRWGPPGGHETAWPFEAYLAERIEFLRHPPEGA
ncbi:hypothetical protein [Cryobacterium tepidiphilum]|uniref:Glutaminase n=1 Tax=Cryobacterium tepidiphilum TaxID=2486026 RepID=A0A3M8LGK9_9MICO|nr:hypothetical protein [Cryobacterium tepidiphilum]RNE63814.1 hypothetical protein EEJ31_06205 [Cryobacterium tepidiphilum]